MSRVSRFQGGRFNPSTYVCSCCGKRTRDTGLGETSVDLCAACFVEASMENTHSDNGHSRDLDKTECPECIKECDDFFPGYLPDGTKASKEAK